MLFSSTMSDTEKRFIRLYVNALRRDFNLVKSVIALMHPDGLAISDFSRATRVAVELQHMHAEFDTCLHNLPISHKFFKKTAATGPTLDDLAELFTLSFFKVLTTFEGSKGIKKKTDAGWFSGKPDEWQQLFKQLAATAGQSNKKQSPMLNMFSKFFPQLDLFKDFDFSAAIEDNTPNQWPPSGFAKDIDYDDEQYDEDDDD